MCYMDILAQLLISSDSFVEVLRARKYSAIAKNPAFNFCQVTKYRLGKPGIHCSDTLNIHLNTKPNMVPQPCSDLNKNDTIHFPYLKAIDEERHYLKDWILK